MSESANVQADLDRLAQLGHPALLTEGQRQWRAALMQRLAAEREREEREARERTARVGGQRE